ncbi:phosphoribosyltransferase [Pelomicrobium sp. G1]|uniref:phosphoribosyltransferase n=1 Tax=unclassified Pelomicrobium TaxID=2815318 RepID=UPI003F7637AC
MTAPIVDLEPLRNRAPVFADRAEAGRVLASMLEAYRGSDALVLAIPAGGVPVAAEAARALGLPLDVAVVSKILLPWTTEAGYGAVAFDGTVRLNQALVDQLGLPAEEVARGIAETRAKVERRLARLRAGRPFPPLAGRPAILVDDGLASGLTMMTAAEALRRAGAAEIAVAVPTGHSQAALRVAPSVDRLYCANLRSGHRFAVADAYRRWYDVPEEEALALLREAAS